ncbi:hypothetical protein ASJ81_02065 [Methanosarcina spelaei]|uniref:Uncharacterized protein n=1 Tax=Methanosarcina spelaei TaxID=1036679 RepID=A0A2A2HNI0_9EURY|nr:hypothetical protein ASJ81_02065 [Methanosarcina spelaei]
MSIFSIVCKNLNSNLQQIINTANENQRNKGISYELLKKNFKQMKIDARKHNKIKLSQIKLPYIPKNIKTYGPI